MLQKDQALVGKYPPVANSWAYCALDLDNSSALTDLEKTRVDMTKMLEKPEVTLPFDEMLTSKVNSVMAQYGKETKMPEVPKVDSLPAELQSLYKDMMMKGVKSRLSKDLVYPTLPAERVANLKKLL